MKHKKAYDICKEEFAFAISKATHKLWVNIEDLFQLAGMKWGRQNYYNILKSWKASKSTVKKLKQYVDLDRAITVKEK